MVSDQERVIIASVRYRIASTYGLETFIVKLNLAYDAGIPDRHVNMSHLYIYYRNIMLLALYVLTLWLCNTYYQGYYLPQVGVK